MQLGKVCALRDWDDPDLKNMMLDIYPENAPFLPRYTWHFAPKCGEPVQQRKLWEWAIGMLSLRQLGKLKPNAMALGIGAGYELPSFWLTRHVRYVIATDLYNASKWLESDLDMLTTPEAFCPFPFDGSKLSVRIMDGTNITFEDETFDIVYSYSSIEHFGGLQAACKAMREIGRVLKPGGVATIATELVIEGNATKTEFFSENDITELVDASGMTLTNQIDFNIGDMRGVVKIPEEAAKTPHIIIEIGCIKSTSIHLALIKPTT